MRNLLDLKKINYKALIKYFFFNEGIWMSKKTQVNDLKNFISRFRDNYINVELERIGSKNNDGGYLVPKKLLNSIKYCFSPGTANDASFENNLSKDYNIKSFMADASVKGPPTIDKNFYFIKKFLSSFSEDKINYEDKNLYYNNKNDEKLRKNKKKGWGGIDNHVSYITLSEWIKTYSKEFQLSGNNMILQMDIEESEYEVLTYESSRTLAKFSIMVIEFHALHNIFERHFFQMLKAIFEKIYNNFFICHAHPNNNAGISNIDGVEVPNTLEITFIRKDFAKKLKLNAPKKIPNLLDKKNNKDMPDIVLPANWY
jgi:hypothetical protein